MLPLPFVALFRHHENIYFDPTPHIPHTPTVMVVMVVVVAAAEAVGTRQFVIPLAAVRISLINRRTSLCRGWVLYTDVTLLSMRFKAISTTHLYKHISVYMINYPTMCDEQPACHVCCVINVISVYLSFIVSSANLHNVLRIEKIFKSLIILFKISTIHKFSILLKIIS